jgi:Domain of unknown function (DUF4234)
MAYDIEIGQTQATVRVRRPWAVTLLSILTLGVYSVVWYYKVNREMRDYGSAGGDSDLAGSKPVQSVLAVTIARRRRPGLVVKRVWIPSIRRPADASAGGPVRAITRPHPSRPSPALLLLVVTTRPMLTPIPRRLPEPEIRSRPHTPTRA